MPRSTISANVAPRSISELLMQHAQYIREPDAMRRMNPWADRFVLGLPLAPWQREFKWDDEQCERLIQSIWLDLDIGTYLINDVLEFESAISAEPVTLPNCGIVLDGQQRLTAIERYITGKIAARDVDNRPCYWHELGVVEQRRFGRKIFNRAAIQSMDESMLREAYNLRNYAGMPHLESERA